MLKFDIYHFLSYLSLLLKSCHFMKYKTKQEIFVFTEKI